MLLGTVELFLSLSAVKMSTGTGSYSDTPYSDYAVHTLRVRIFWPNAHITYFPTYCSKSGISHTFAAYPHYVHIFPAYFCIFSLIVGAYLGIFQIFFTHISCLYTSHIWEIVTQFSGFPRYVTHSVTGFPA